MRFRFRIASTPSAVVAWEETCSGDFHTKAVAMLFESQSFIERVRVCSLQIARQHELVTTSVASLLHCVFHHCSPDSATLVLLRNCDIFDDGRLPSSSCQIIHD